jgi:uncharacterized ferritin-like protein (DUF455 family)
MATRHLNRAWRAGNLTHEFDRVMPDRPLRPDRPILLAPNKMPKRRRGGSAAGRIAMLHAFAHIEYVAIDLALDMTGRFGKGQPRNFVTDWLGVAADEAMHFALLDRRLHALGSHYGALPAHDGLWDAAKATAHDLMARLAVVPMVLEARGLDVSPATIARFNQTGDTVSAAILNRIYHDEIRHVGIGSHWFANLCDSHGELPGKQWEALVRKHFRGLLKLPFNDSARESAGLSRVHYYNLASPDEVPQ